MRKLIKIVGIVPLIISDRRETSRKKRVAYKNAENVDTCYVDLAFDNNFKKYFCHVLIKQNLNHGDGTKATVNTLPALPPRFYLWSRILFLFCVRLDGVFFMVLRFRVGDRH